MDTLNDAIRYCKNIYKIEANDKWGHFEQIKKWLQELSDIKELQNKERNVTLPCNIKDKVYLIEPLWMYDDNRWKDEKFNTIYKLSLREEFIDHFEIGHSSEITIVLKGNLHVSADKFGEHIFTDLDEAQIVLKKARETFEKNNIHFKS